MVACLDVFLLWPSLLTLIVGCRFVTVLILGSIRYLACPSLVLVFLIILSFFLDFVAAYFEVLFLSHFSWPGLLLRHDSEAVLSTCS